MAREQSEKNTHELPDDYWIFEELGSPVKLANKRQGPSESSKASTSKDLDENEFQQKLRIYANNMRKLIVTARKSIKELKQENATLKRKLESSGLLECPACLYHFKPERKHRILPKYIKVFRGKLALEVEFSSLNEMSEWLTVNQLDENSDGLPTLLQKDEKQDLTTAGSLLHKLLSEKKESEAKRERVVISTRPGNSHPELGRSAAAHPFSRDRVEATDDVEESCPSGDKHSSQITKAQVEEGSGGPTSNSDSLPSANADRLSEDFEGVKQPSDQLPFEACANLISSIKESLSIDVPSNSDGRQNGRGNSEESERNPLRARDEPKSKASEEQGGFRRRVSVSHRYDREEGKRRREVSTYKDDHPQSTRNHSSGARKEENIKRSSKEDDRLGKRFRTDSSRDRSRISCRSNQARSPVKVKKEHISSASEKHDPDRSRRHKASSSGKENAYHKEGDRDGRCRTRSPHHRKVDINPKNKHDIKSALSDISSKKVTDSQSNKNGNSQRHESRSHSNKGKSDRHPPLKETRDHQRDKRDSSARRSPLKFSHRSDASKEYSRGSKGPEHSLSDRAVSRHSKERSNCRRSHTKEESRHESTRRSHSPQAASVSSKRRKLSTSSHNDAEGQEQELVVSDIELVMVDEDEVEDGEVLD
ncbi:hypothetical protein V3C99_005846 [Haemonchus contortus]|uniref:CASP8-associated protein 2 n=1 Tax=Haemonchus contortus TaxID=6289 RepID=A0A7I4XU13_HAECO